MMPPEKTIKVDFEYKYKLMITEFTVQLEEKQQFSQCALCHSYIHQHTKETLSTFTEELLLIKNYSSVCRFILCSYYF